jgi:hypothetical protein
MRSLDTHKMSEEGYNKYMLDKKRDENGDILMVEGI